MLLTGDSTIEETRMIRICNIIVTTPEKWDSWTRQWTDHRSLIKLVRLLLVDEIHIIKDKRGSTLEVVVTRMKGYFANQGGQKIRIVAVSATIPNIVDFASWLSNYDGTPATFLYPQINIVILARNTGPYNFKKLYLDIQVPRIHTSSKIA
jgi:ATP-dependent DNA helicase HFM1/MER3